MMEKITEKLGDFGRYQLFLYVLALIVGFMGGIQANILIWIGYVPTVRCRIPSIDGDSSIGSDFSSNLTESLLGGYSDKLNGYCNYCPEQANNTPYTNCTEEIWQKCDAGLVYDRSFIQNSLGMEYDMACEGVYKLNLAKSATMVGMLIGAATFGTLADRFGRRLSTLISLTGHILLYFGSAFLFRINYPVMLIVQMLTIAFEYGSYMITYTVFMELAGGVYRTTLGALFQGAYTFGNLYMALVVYFFRDWTAILLISGAPLVLLLPYFWIFPESIRYAITTGDEKIAVKTLNQAAKMNKIDLNAAQLVQDELNEVATSEKSEKRTVVDLLFTDIQLTKATLITFFSWLAVAMLFYGLGLNTTDFPGDPLVSFTVLTLADFPGMILCIPAMERFGRRSTLVIFLGLAGICVIATTLPLPDWLVLTLAVFGKTFASGAFSVVYNYSAELFPTVARTNGVGWGSCSARIGAISAPFIRDLGYYVESWLPFAIYGGVGLLAAFLCVFLPETKGRPLPETIDDGTRFVRNLPLQRKIPRDSEEDPDS